MVAAAPAYRWLVKQTPGVLRQLEREFTTDDHRLWPKDAPRTAPADATPLPQKTWQKIGERMQTELELRDKGSRRGCRCPARTGQSRQPQPPELRISCGVSASPGRRSTSIRMSST